MSKGSGSKINEWQTLTITHDFYYYIKLKSFGTHEPPLSYKNNIHSNTQTQNIKIIYKLKEAFQGYVLFNELKLIHHESILRNLVPDFTFALSKRHFSPKCTVS